MPELAVAERLPNLTIPEFKPDELARTLSEIQLPGRRSRRRRWPIAIGAVVAAAMAGAAILRSDTVRAALRERLMGLRERLSMAWTREADFMRDDPIAFPTADTAPMQASPYTDPATAPAADYPEGLGSE
jgi:hypothetical protein